jgi:hypothetical protein
MKPGRGVELCSKGKGMREARTEAGAKDILDGKRSARKDTGAYNTILRRRKMLRTTQKKQGRRI